MEPQEGTPRAEAQPLMTLGRLSPTQPILSSHTHLFWSSPHPPGVLPQKAGITCLTAKTPRLVRHSQQQGQDHCSLHKSIPTRVHQVPRSQRQSPRLEAFLRENGFTRTHLPSANSRPSPGEGSGLHHASRTSGRRGPRWQHGVTKGLQVTAVPGDNGQRVDTVRPGQTTGGVCTGRGP